MPDISRLLDIFRLYTIPLDEWIEFAIEDWLVGNYRWFFQGLKVPVERVLEGFQSVLSFPPPLISLVIVFAIAWWLAGWRIALFSLLGLALVGYIGVWPEAITTLSIVLSAVLFCVVVGIPLGILASRSDRFEGSIRPVLDAMQTTPAFVYLVPVVMLFSIGTVAGTIATIIFALPPIIRLTNLGIRQVRFEVLEAAYSFGATPMQALIEIQIPLALRTIMAGLNQTLMLSLSMVVIAALIGAGGLGLVVFEGLNRLDVGRAAVGGIGIVILAIILDRITQGLGQTAGPGGAARGRNLWAFMQQLLGRRKPSPAEAELGARGTASADVESQEEEIEEVEEKETTRRMR